jgi:hypothetical protein
MVTKMEKFEFNIRLMMENKIAKKELMKIFPMMLMGGVMQTLKR